MECVTKLHIQQFGWENNSNYYSNYQETPLLIKKYLSITYSYTDSLHLYFRVFLYAESLMEGNPILEQGNFYSYIQKKLVHSNDLQSY